AAADQSLSPQTAALQRRLEDRYLPVDFCRHSLPGTPHRFLAPDGQLCRRQSKAALGNHLAAFLGHPDHFVRSHFHVLHDARVGPRNWKGKGAADILRSDACPAGWNKALMARRRRTTGIVSMKDDWKPIFPETNK